jgi:hypothetical protein
MGCDIHIIIEKKHNGKWVGWPCEDHEATARNYERFAKLAGVRGEGPDAKGIPPDASDMTLLWKEDRDFHSWSYGSVKEVALIFAATEGYFDEKPKKLTKKEKDEAPFKYFGIEDDGKNYRIVYAFDS